MDSINTVKDRSVEAAKKAVVQSADKVADGAEQVSSMVKTVTDRGMEAAQDQLEILRKESAELLKAVEKSIRKSPIASVGIAAGVGVVVAGIVGFAARGILSRT